MSEIILWSDTETRSECELKSAGTAKYAEHPSTRVQLFSYAFNEDPVRIWSPEDREPMPDSLEDALEDPSVILQFHNVFFDRSVLIATKQHLRRLSRRKKDWSFGIERFRCSMARALSHGLPGGLEKLGEVLGIREDAKKIADGHRLVRMFCKPCGYLKDGVTYRWNTPETHPEDWARYKEYCANDTAAMREIVKKIPKWNYPGNAHEVELWRMDQRINNRGMFIDLDLVNAAMNAISVTQAQLSCSTKEMTGGAVQNATQRDEMLKHILAEYDIELPNMQKATLNRLLESEDLHPALRDLLEVRLSACTTSTAKYKRIAQATCTDGRLKGTIQFAGASRTLRDGGRIAQPQNYPSRGLMTVEDTKFGIEALKFGMEEIFDLDVMWLAQSSIRYSIISPPDKKLLVSDLSGIEGRALAYLAGEEWKLQAYREFDAGTGPDLYKLTYAKAFGVDPNLVSKEQRNGIGKPLDLSMGYHGGVSAFITFATSVGADLEDLVSLAKNSIPEDIMREAISFYGWLEEQGIADARKKAMEAGTPKEWLQYMDRKRTLHLSTDVFTVCDSLKRLWRREHPATVQLWADTEAACRNAVEIPNKNFHFGNNCYARRSGKWVRIVLPSGHSLCYPGMEIHEGKLRFKGLNQFTKKWGWIETFSGKLVENCWVGATRVLTDRGIIAITAVTAEHKVWDGENWVSTDGVIYQGEKEVGAWLGEKVTSNHRIFDGKKWRELRRMGLSHALLALEWGRFSVPLQSSKGAKRNWAKADASVPAAQSISSLTNRLVEAVVFSVISAVIAVVRKKEGCSLISSLCGSTISGGTGTQECYGDVITLNAQNTAIMAQGESKSLRIGEKINVYFSNILKRYRTGIQKAMPWIEKITRKATFKEIYDSYQEWTISITDETRCISNIKGLGTPMPNLKGPFYLIGRAITRWYTIFPKVDRQNGLWKNTMREEKVFDLLNCGPNNQYTVVTKYGPVIVHNCTQAFARDIFKYGQLEAENRGYDVILPVHDELVCEVPDTDEYSVHHLEAIMATVPPWAEGIPLAAEGFSDYAYHK